MLNRRHPIDIIQALPKRFKESHKGTYGRLLIIAGSRRYTGAAALMVEAALRSGVGLVIAVAIHDVAQVIRFRSPEAIVMEAPEADGAFDKQVVGLIRDVLNEYDCTAVGIGPGLGPMMHATPIYDGMHELLMANHWPMLVDADALAPIYQRVLANPIDDARVVFTTHPKEFLTMTNASQLDEKNKAVLLAAKQARQVIVYKTNGTIIGSPDGIWNCRTGNEGLATAGSGDVLSGMVAGLLAQGVPPFQAAKVGVYMHGLTAEIASKALGLRSIIASDLCNTISEAFQELVQYHG